MRTLLKIEEVAVALQVSVKTINNWYAFKRAKPNSDLAKLLPDFVQMGSRQTRYWDNSDIYRMMEFKKQIPKGRNGLMGCVTQKYIK